MKNSFLAFTALMVITSGQIYTQNQVKRLAHNVAEFSKWEKGTLKPISLGELLYANIHTHIDRDTVIACGNNKKDTLTVWPADAGIFTPQQYKNGWRTMLINDPNLTYSALSLYGQSFIDAYNKELLIKYEQVCNENKQPCHIAFPQKAVETWRIDSATAAANLKKFSISAYWRSQRESLSRYQLLMTKLLSLSDKQLNSFIATVGREQESITKYAPPIGNVEHWIYNQKLIKELPTSTYNYWQDSDHGGWYMMDYPCDLLLLTYRVSHDYPAWTPRKFLNEASKFSTEVLKTLPR